MDADDPRSAGPTISVHSFASQPLHDDQILVPFESGYLGEPHFVLTDSSMPVSAPPTLPKVDGAASDNGPATTSYRATPTPAPAAKPDSKNMSRTSSIDGWPNGLAASNKLLSSLGLHGSRSPSRTPSAPSSPRLTPRIPDSFQRPGITSSTISKDGRIKQVESKLVIVMVGLPARGKSYITRKLVNYLNWLGRDTKLFNVGEKRRNVSKEDIAKSNEAADKGEDYFSCANLHSAFFRAPQPVLAKIACAKLPLGAVTEQGADFFDPSNKLASTLREQLAMDTLDDLLDYIVNGDGVVGIFDATNSTLARRSAIMQKIRSRAPSLRVLFIESICSDAKVLDANMRLKLQGPDYKGRDPEIALADFKARVANYEHSYVPLGQADEDLSRCFIQMFDVGRKFIEVGVKEWGFLENEVRDFITRFHLSPRQIWITRHGETFDNLDDRIGGTSTLTPRGIKFSQALAKFIDAQKQLFYRRQVEKYKEHVLGELPESGAITPPAPDYVPEAMATGEDEDPPEKNFLVWTSSLERSKQTAQFFDENVYGVKHWRSLDEICAGKFEGMTYAEIKEKYPEEYQKRRENKLEYKYPGAGGESYLDIINKMESVIKEMERITDNILLVGHRVIVRILLAYFAGRTQAEVTAIDVPLDVVYCIEPKPYGIDLKGWRWVEGTDTFEHLDGYGIQLIRTRHDGE